MKKSIWIFLLAVLLPSVVLGWLALRSAEEQQIILERRTAELYQKQTDAVAETARALVDEQRRAFTDVVRKLLAAEPPVQLARNFSTKLAASWPRRAIGFALGADGKLMSPSAQGARSNAEWQKFLLDNGGFLSGTIPAQVYWVSAEELNRPEALRKGKTGYDNKLANATLSAAVQDKLAPSAKAENYRDEAAAQNRRKDNAREMNDESVLAQSAATAPAAPMPVAAPVAPAAAAMPAKKMLAEPKRAAAEKEPVQKDAEQSKSRAIDDQALKQAADQPQFAQNYERQEVTLRNVAPQRMLEENGQVLSQIVPSTADFRALTTDSDEGVVTRFMQDRLEILFWLRSPLAPEMIFGCLLEAESLRDLWPDALPASYGSRSRAEAPEFVLALLDDRARPIVTQPPGETGRDWKRPFVASEVGEALPHWEATLYLMRPQQLLESARSVRRTLIFMIVAALGAIAAGGWLVVADARRQLALAQQKTDFVSNVSHELKTPLTSIRMFAELMQNGRGETAAKHPQYLRIIMVEAERLTRLINNVLDFARIDRRQKQYDKRPLDLHALIARTWEGHELHLRESGFTTRWQAAPPPYPVVGDEDALAQILVNLLSNAEKYAGQRKEVELHSYRDGGRLCVSVLDRGSGVPAGEERKIFEAFYRAEDSLSSGIQGSGLGLTLAQRLATEHGGEITYQAREGGGSNFTLRLPLAETETFHP